MNLAIEDEAREVTTHRHHGVRGRRRLGWETTVAIDPISVPRALRLELRIDGRQGAKWVHDLGAIDIVPRTVEDPTLVDQRDAVQRAMAALPSGETVAIVLPVGATDAAILDRVIGSVHRQTHQSWLAVVSPQGVAGPDLDAIRRMTQQDPRFILAPSRGDDEVVGWEHALSLVPEAADYVALTTDMDEWHDDRLERMIRALGRDSSLVFSHLRMVRPHGTVVMEQAFPPPLRAELDVGPMLTSRRQLRSTTLMRRALMDVLLPIPPGISDLAALEAWVGAVASAGGYIEFIEEPLVDRLTAEEPWRFWQSSGDTAGVDTVEHLAEASASLTCLETLQLRMRGAQSRVGARRVGRARKRLSRKLRLISATQDRPASQTALVAEGDARLAVAVSDLHKRFELPGDGPQTLKGVVTDPLRRRSRRDLVVLDGISFDVRQGEFFGVVGRNGSGKSTLLKLMAGIYRADSGRIRVAQRVAPVIELGVGFQPALAAKDNVLMNAEMMGVSPQDALYRFDEMLAFAELEDFADLQLKNYSSGMRVRLAFAIALLTDADLYLFDEVLAVGDAAFQEKCRRTFAELKRDDSKTVVLVTHAMSAIQMFCDRALLLEGGRTELVGDASEVAGRYTELLIGSPATSDASLAERDPTLPATITSLWIEREDGTTAQGVRLGENIVVRAAVEVGEVVRGPALRVELRNETQVRVVYMPALDLALDGPLQPGEHLDIDLALENKLTPGRYTLTCAIVDRDADGERAVSAGHIAEFVVLTGTRPGGGVFYADHQLRVTRTRSEQVVVGG